MSRFELERKSFQCARGFTYSYIHMPSSADKPTLFFLHGFPSHLSDWTYQIDYFASRGYGILACDLLGFGQSSRPSDAHSYRLKPVSDDLAELIDRVARCRVIGVGHDIGSTILSRLAMYHAEKFLGLVFLAVGPPRLGTPFDLNAINSMTRQMMGYELLGYMEWLTDGAQSMLEKNSASAMSLMFARNSVQVWKQWFHPLHKMEEFVTDDKRVPIGAWYTADLQEEHLTAFHQKGGYTGAIQWYCMWRDNLFSKDEEGFESKTLQQPCLLVVHGEAEQQVSILAEWTPNLTVEHVDSGHWVHIEGSEETNTAIENFLKRRE